MRTLLFGCVILSLASTATAQWSDDFDGYANGTTLFGVGGWSGWGNVAGVAGTVTNAQASSAPHGLLVTPSIDAVHPFSPAYTTGTWQLTARHYISSASFTGDTYFIVNTIYSPPNYGWSVEVQFDFGSSTVLDDFRAETNVIPIVFDAWVDIRLDIDLAANTLTTYYNGTVLSTGTYTTSYSGGTVAIANIDLYSDSGTCYYDDVCLQQPGVWTLTASQPDGPASIYIGNYGGAAGNWYLNAMTQVQGNYPAGWCYGVDIPVPDLVTEILWGPPFFGPLGACGAKTTIISGPIPSGITAYIVGVRLVNGIPVEATAPAVYVTP